VSCIAVLPWRTPGAVVNRSFTIITQDRQGLRMSVSA
jgi:hypothetical protein